MILERTKDEILIRLPGTLEFSYLEDLLNYLNVKAILAKSEATDEDIEMLSEEVKSSWWTENKSRFIDESNS